MRRMIRVLYRLAVLVVAGAIAYYLVRPLLIRDVGYILEELNR